MTAQLVDWNALKAPDFPHWHRDFTAIDPDRQGAFAVYADSQQVAIGGLDKPGAAAKAIASRAHGAIVLVIESPYIGKSAASGLDVAKRAAALAGMVAAYADTRVEAVWVAPATWQAWLRRQHGGLKGQKLKRDDWKALAWSWAFPREQQDDKMQGLADALCIGAWWRSIE